MPAEAHASLLSRDGRQAGDFIALFVMFVVPIVLIVLFWMVHVLPEKIAHKRHHPQFDAIRTLCLLSLVFGGLLWPIAWLWAYTKPVVLQAGLRHRQARGLLHGDTELHGAGDAARAAFASGWRPGGARPARPRLKALRADLAALEAQRRRRRRGALMEVLLLGIYSFFVWLIFIKLKWLPWTTPWKVTVVIIPIVAMAALILLAQHLRAVVVRRARGQVRRADRLAGAGPRDRGAGREQPAGEEGRRAVPDRPDALPARRELARGAARGGRGARSAPSASEVAEAQARLADAQSGERQLKEQLKQATEPGRLAAGVLELARKRVRRTGSWRPPAPATVSTSSRRRPM